MNYHSDNEIMTRVNEHLMESKEYFPEDKIVGIFYQGSGNYGLDYENSDVDTKLIILPSFKDIAFNHSPISTTHVRKNDEHIDFKDIRLYMHTFRKQNINFLEILFTTFKWINDSYKDEWNKLIENREAIAHYNPYQAVKAMKGHAIEKYHAMEHNHPSRAQIVLEYGYDPKQLHHLLRIEEYISRYISGEPYADCLHSSNSDFLIAVKRGIYKLDQARNVGAQAINHTIEMSDKYTEKIENRGDPEIDELFNSVQYAIMEKAIKKELA